MTASAAHPLVSILVPAYNHAKYVGETLDSVRFAAYPNVELVVIDDGSPDGTWEAIQSWVGEYGSQMRVRVARQENIGIGRTLNRLLGMGHGEFASCLASDDRLLPGGLAPRVELLVRRPDLVAVFGDCRVIDGHGEVTAEHGVGFSDPVARRRYVQDAAMEIVANWSVPGPVLLLRRAAILAVGGFAEDLPAEDWDLYLRLASRRQIAFIDTPVADYRWHGANAGALPPRALEMADGLRDTARRNRHFFRGRLYIELVHESASWAARAARLRRRWLAWAGWKAVSIGLKLIAMAVSRRPSDQKLAPPAQ